MLKVSSVTSIFLVLFLVFSFVLHPMTYAETVFKEIDSESAARQIATKADGIYVKGTAAPTLSGAEVALPILDEASGEVLGHIVAEQIKLISVLAGTAAGTGFALGTVGTVAAVVAVGTGIALIVSSGGSNSTTSHP
jgi:hypothetical protein